MASTAIRNKQNSELHIHVALKRADFSYFNWVLAFERPILPFFAYTFTLLILADLFKIWPDARLYAFAVLVPALAYLLFVWLTTQTLWGKIKALHETSTYTFSAASYSVKQHKESVSIAYTDITRVLESRKGIYLIRQDGSADILPKDAVGKEALEPYFEKNRWRSSSFL